MNKKIGILHLEDSFKDSELIQSVIQSGGIEHEYFLVDNEKDFIGVLETKNIDIILSDYSLPDYNGTEVLKLAREKYAYIPFIFISGIIGEDAAISATLNGATDIVFKNKLRQLIPVIKRALHEHEQKLKIKLLEAGEALIKSEIKYKDLINEVSDGYFVTNNQGIITFANISLAKIFGFISPEEMTGHLFTEFNKKSDTQDVSYNFKNIIKNKKNVNGLEREVFRVDRNPIHIEIKAVSVLEDGKVVGMQGVIRDITDRKKKEEELRVSKDLLEKLNYHLEEVRENERASIARDIHDQLGQSLTALKLDINRMQEYVTSNQDAMTMLNGMLEMVTNTISDVQRITADLRPGILDDLGLVSAIDWYCGEFSTRTGIKCKLRFCELINEDSKRNLIFFRVLQEALTNVIRHANATTVKIGLYQSYKGITLTIKDNGIGITREQAVSGRSLGLTGIRERVKQSNGKFDISSDEGTGTKLIIFIPYK